MHAGISVCLFFYLALAAGRESGTPGALKHDPTAREAPFGFVRREGHTISHHALESSATKAISRHNVHAGRKYKDEPELTMKLADPGDNCSLTCTNMRQSCVEEELTGFFWNQTKVWIAFDKASINCTSFDTECTGDPNSCAAHGAPYMHTSDVVRSGGKPDGFILSGECYWGNPAAGCSTIPSDSESMRICPCRER
mmetsp:Transcript_44399/g.78061  ORF Transcript_44399/g.78061 Transcript_44399/m.78061 type:complete len:197 (+) Transcript_44399:57-647(+)